MLRFLPSLRTSWLVSTSRITSFHFTLRFITFVFFRSSFITRLPFLPSSTSRFALLSLLVDCLLQAAFWLGFGIRHLGRIGSEHIVSNFLAPMSRLVGGFHSAAWVWLLVLVSCAFMLVANGSRLAFHFITSFQHWLLSVWPSFGFW